MIRCLELFAGAGGAALGLEAAGLTHAALCEWDRDACATLRAAGLGPVVEGDVRDLDAIAAAVGPAPVDVLWSSFPCQAFSTAGKRLGAADERNGWPWTVDAIDRFCPTWLLGENVRGLLLHRAGCTYRGGQEGLFAAPDPQGCPGCYFERVILPDLRARFAHVGWWLLDAADFGVPQHRRRVILWAGPAPLAEPTPTHGPGRALPWVSMGEALGLDEGERAVLPNRVPPQDVTNEPSPTIDNHTGITGDTFNCALRIMRADGPAPTVTTEWGHCAPWTKAGAGWLVQSGVCDSACETHGVARECVRPAPTVPVSSHLYLAAPSPTVTTTEQKGGGTSGHPKCIQQAAGMLYIQSGPDGEIRSCANQPAPTVVTGWGNVSVYNTFGAACVATPEGRRRLTVEECATLQDFPSDHPWQGGVGARYRQVGNAVPPRLAEVVGRALVEAVK